MPHIIDINGYLAPRIGSTGNVVTTSGFGTITSISVNGITCSITGTATNQATFTIPGLVDGQSTPFLGYYHDHETRSIVTFTVSDGTNTNTLTKRILPPTGLVWATLETGFLTTESGSILYNFSPTPAVNDQIYYDPTTCSVDVHGRFRSHLNTTQTLWHREFSSGTVRSFTVTTADSGSITVNVTGVATTASVGTVSVTLGSAPMSASVTGVSAAANVGSAIGSIYVQPSNTEVTLTSPINHSVFKNVFSAIGRSFYIKRK